MRLGDHDLGRSDDDTNPEEYGIKKFIKHNGYESRTRANDIALIKLDRTVIFTTFIRPACLQHKWNFGKKVNAVKFNQSIALHLLKKIFILSKDWMGKNKSYGRIIG